MSLGTSWKQWNNNYFLLSRIFFYIKLSLIIIINDTGVVRFSYPSLFFHILSPEKMIHPCKMFRCITMSIWRPWEHSLKWANFTCMWTSIGDWKFHPFQVISNTLLHMLAWLWLFECIWKNYETDNKICTLLI